MSRCKRSKLAENAEDCDDLETQLPAWQESARLLVDAMRC
jgi:hypothetical protein